jgi:hypothetical protein
VVGVTWACAEASAPRIDDADLLPASLRLVAEAHGVNPDGLRIDCTVETVITLHDRVERSAGRTVQHGEGGGDATRYRDVTPERAVQFWAHTYFTGLEFHLLGGDSIEVRSPESETATERFWREFAVWPGSRRHADPLTGELARGPWTCQPMDTPPESGEYYDAAGTAVGSWSLMRNR